MSKEKKQDSLNIELSEEVAHGIYSNIAIINHLSFAKEFSIIYNFILITIIYSIHYFNKKLM